MSKSKERELYAATVITKEYGIYCFLVEAISEPEAVGIAISAVKKTDEQAILEVRASNELVNSEAKIVNKEVEKDISF